MSAPIQLRAAARSLYDLRQAHGWEALHEALGDLEPDDLADLLACWELSAHPAQVRPEGVLDWMIMAGRGFGKTRAGAEDTLNTAEEWGPNFRGLLASKTYQRDIVGVMLRGEAGLNACAERRGYTLNYVATEARVYFPAGGYATMISADNPEAYRGQEINFAWADEIAKWQKPVYAWRNIIASKRAKIQQAPTRTIVTTTPKRGSAIVLALLNNPRFHVTKGRTLDNVANLDAGAVQQMIDDMGGTSFGRQELDGEFNQGAGAMTSQAALDKHRVPSAPRLARRIVTFDPAITDKEDSDDHGILAMGTDFDRPQNAYLLEDRTLAQGSPEAAARAVVELAIEWDAHAIVAELNQGGDWIKSMLRVAMELISVEKGRNVFFPIVGVWAKQAKEVRAEPVGALCDLGRARCAGTHREAERELSTWIPGMPSPNRLDAFVHGATHLLLGQRPATLTPYGAA